MTQFSKRANSKKTSKLLAPTWGINCHWGYQLISRLSGGYIYPKWQKKHFEIEKNKVLKFYIFWPPGTFGGATAKRFKRFAWNFACKSQSVRGIFVPNFSFLIKFWIFLYIHGGPKMQNFRIFLLTLKWFFVFLG